VSITKANWLMVWDMISAIIIIIIIVVVVIIIISSSSRIIVYQHPDLTDWLITERAYENKHKQKKKQHLPK
jgi:Co/Zn/Cd efflux system component